MHNTNTILDVLLNNQVVVSLLAQAYGEGSYGGQVYSPTESQQSNQVQPSQGAPIYSPGVTPVTGDNPDSVTSDDEDLDEDFNDDFTPEPVFNETTEETVTPISSSEEGSGTNFVLIGGIILAVLAVVVIIALVIRKLRSRSQGGGGDSAPPTQGWNNWQG